jgi:hypothetical protein
MLVVNFRQRNIAEWKLGDEKNCSNSVARFRVSNHSKCMAVARPVEFKRQFKYGVRLLISVIEKQCHLLLKQRPYILTALAYAFQNNAQ